MTGSVIAAVERYLNTDGRKLEHQVHSTAVPKYNVDAFDVIFTRTLDTLLPIERAAYNIATFLFFKKWMSAPRFRSVVTTLAVCPYAELSVRWHGRPDRDAFHSYVEGVLGYAVENEAIPALLLSISNESKEALRRPLTPDERAFMGKHLSALDY